MKPLPSRGLAILIGLLCVLISGVPASALDVRTPLVVASLVGHDPGLSAITSHAFAAVTTPLGGSWATQVSAGDSHTCALTVDGGVKCWGGNNYGQLGDGTTEGRLAPVDVMGLQSGMQAIALGSDHSCALTTSGGVRCWGKNAHGQLGDGTTQGRLTPVDVAGLGSDVRAIAAGLYHTCAVTASGGVKCWGLNNGGQLGDGTGTQHLTPVDVAGLTTGVRTVTAGYFHTCALTESGGAKCWGLNYAGELGDGTFTARLTPVDVLGLTGGVQAISAGSIHTCAVTASRSARCWGINDYGQLGDGTTAWRLTPKCGGFTGWGDGDQRRWQSYLCHPGDWRSQVLGRECQRSTG